MKAENNNTIYTNNNSNSNKNKLKNNKIVNLFKHKLLINNNIKTNSTISNIKTNNLNINTAVTPVSCVSKNTTKLKTNKKLSFIDKLKVKSTQNYKLKKNLLNLKGYIEKDIKSTIIKEPISDNNNNNKRIILNFVDKSRCENNNNNYNNYNNYSNNNNNNKVKGTKYLKFLKLFNNKSKNKQLDLNIVNNKNTNTSPTNNDTYYNDKNITNLNLKDNENKEYKLKNVDNNINNINLFKNSFLHGLKRKHAFINNTGLDALSKNSRDILKKMIYTSIMNINTKMYNYKSIEDELIQELKKPILDCFKSSIANSINIKLIKQTLSKKNKDVKAMNIANSKFLIKESDQINNNNNNLNINSYENSERNVLKIANLIQSIKGFKKFMNYINIDYSAIIGASHLITVKSYRKNTVIFNQGDKSDCFYGILKGKVCILKDRNKINYDCISKSKHKLGELTVGNCFGEWGLVDSTTRSSYIKAIENCVLFKVSKNCFDLYFKKFITKAETERKIFVKYVFNYYDKLSHSMFLTFFKNFTNLYLEKGNIIYDKNIVANSFYMVYQGECECRYNLEDDLYNNEYKNEEGISIIKYSKGSIFGLESLEYKKTELYKFNDYLEGNYIDCNKERDSNNNNSNDNSCLNFNNTLYNFKSKNNETEESCISSKSSKSNNLNNNNKKNNSRRLNKLKVVKESDNNLFSVIDNINSNISNGLSNNLNNNNKIYDSISNNSIKTNNSKETHELMSNKNEINSLLINKYSSNFKEVNKPYHKRYSKSVSITKNKEAIALLKRLSRSIVNNNNSFINNNNNNNNINNKNIRINTEETIKSFKKGINDNNEQFLLRKVEDFKKFIASCPRYKTKTLALTDNTIVLKFNFQTFNSDCSLLYNFLLNISKCKNEIIKTLITNYSENIKKFSKSCSSKYNANTFKHNNDHSNNLILKENNLIMKTYQEAKRTIFDLKINKLNKIKDFNRLKNFSYNFNNKTSINNIFKKNNSNIYTEYNNKISKHKYSSIRFTGINWKDTDKSLKSKELVDTSKNTKNKKRHSMINFNKTVLSNDIKTSNNKDSNIKINTNKSSIFKMFLKRKTFNCKNNNNNNSKISLNFNKEINDKFNLNTYNCYTTNKCVDNNNSNIKVNNISCNNLFAKSDLKCFNIKNKELYNNKIIIKSKSLNNCINNTNMLNIKSVQSANLLSINKLDVFKDLINNNNNKLINNKNKYKSKSSVLNVNNYSNNLEKTYKDNQSKYFLILKNNKTINVGTKIKKLNKFNSKSKSVLSSFNINKLYSNTNLENTSLSDQMSINTKYFDNKCNSLINVNKIDSKDIYYNKTIECDINKQSNNSVNLNLNLKNSKNINKISNIFNYSNFKKTSNLFNTKSNNIVSKQSKSNRFDELTKRQQEDYSVLSSNTLIVTNKELRAYFTNKFIKNCLIPDSTIKYNTGKYNLPMINKVNYNFIN